MVICQNCRSSLPDGTRLCSLCGYHISQLPIEPPFGRNSFSNTPGYTAAPGGENQEKTQQFPGFVPEWDNASPTQFFSPPMPGQPLSMHGENHPAGPMHGEHHQAQPIHGAHHQPQTMHGAHHQAQPIHGAHHQPQPMHGAHHQPQAWHGAHHQPQAMHGAHHQPLIQHGKHLKQLQHGCRPSCLVTAVSSLIIISLAAIASLIIYFNNQHNNTVPPSTITPSNITLSLSGNAIPGQMLQVVGNHFTPKQTVFVTLDNQPLPNSAASAYTQYTSVLSMSLVSLSSTTSAGTPVTVQADGTFTLLIHIDADWTAGSSHHLSVNNQQGKELKGLNITVDANQATPTLTPTPTPTPTLLPAPPVVRRPLTSQQTQSQTVNATGQGQTPGTSATGTILILNETRGTALQLSAGTTVTNTAGCTAPGLQISLDSDVDLAAYSGEGPFPQTVVSIHVVQPGTAGNIQDCQSGSLGSTPCLQTCITSPLAYNSTAGGFAFASCSPSCGSGPGNWAAEDLNGGFAGGIDPQPYTTVQQSDIDNTAAPLKTSTTQSAVANIRQQLQANEYLVGTPQCTSNVSSNHKAGDKASQVTITITTTCNAEASNNS